MLRGGTTQRTSEIVPTPHGVIVDVIGALGAVPLQGKDAIITDETVADRMSEVEKLVAFNAVINTMKTKSVKILNVPNLILTIWFLNRRSVCSTSAVRVSDIV